MIELDGADQRTIELIWSLHGSVDEKTNLVRACKSDPRDADAVSACIRNMAWLSERELSPCHDVTALSECFPAGGAISVDLPTLLGLQKDLADQVERVVIGLLVKANDQVKAEGTFRPGAMTILDAIASMLVSKDGRFDPNVVGILIQELDRPVGNRVEDGLSSVYRKYIASQLEELPELASLVHEASDVPLPAHARPLMFLNGEDLTGAAIARADAARIVMVALLELPEAKGGPQLLAEPRQILHSRNRPGSSPQAIGPTASTGLHLLREQRLRRATHCAD